MQQTLGGEVKRRLRVFPKHQHERVRQKVTEETIELQNKTGLVLFLSLHPSDLTSAECCCEKWDALFLLMAYCPLNETPAWMTLSGGTPCKIGTAEGQQPPIRIWLGKGETIMTRCKSTGSTSSLKTSPCTVPLRKMRFMEAAYECCHSSLLQETGKT